MPQVAAPPEGHVLRARGLRYSYDGSPALQGVTLDVRAGEILALTGTRGSGKSTLLACLSGQLPCMGGGLWFGDTPLHTMGRAARERVRRENFGWVGSEPQLIPELTAWENAALPLLLTGTGHRAARRTACEWLDRLDIGALARKRPDHLRQSERQRVALARALAHSPAILFADEPTAPLHRDERAQALRTLSTAARTHLITVVLSTHEAPGAEEPPAVRVARAPIADRVLQLVDGALQEPSAAARPGAAAASETASPAGHDTGHDTSSADASDGNDSKGAECSLSV